MIELSEDNLAEREAQWLYLQQAAEALIRAANKAGFIVTIENRIWPQLTKPNMVADVRPARGNY